ncbi:hypothetical protein OS493_008869 [Desmophyllum pertusum]|uniref:Uncharacterized protein n=1 Tax=Desmophyllum pertusum TaxID=174260 RepID=A0A9X0CY97_9CNID|nr:hypothetical protein OS493_008869 [Desmophyllum pertusum]
MKTHQKVPQTQETSKLGKRLDSPRATVKKDTLKQPSKNNGANKGPILVANKEPIVVCNEEPIVEGNDGPYWKKPLENTNISAKAADDKHGIYRPLSVRPGYMPEVKYVIKILTRVYEDNVKLCAVV